MLTLERIGAGYGDTNVLRDVNLIVPDSSVVALIGPNGVGKTTLLRVASGLLRPSAGRVLLDGVDVTGLSPHDLVAAGVHHIPEGRGIFRSLTVKENLRLFAEPGSEAAAVRTAVEVFPRLGERLGQVAGIMSGGEQQMLALARAYVRRPRFVLLDEVSMGLAPKIVDEIFASLGRLTAEGVSLLLVEQYVTKALAVADYVYTLGRSRIVFAGEPAELEGDDVFAQYVGIPAQAEPH